MFVKVSIQCMEYGSISDDVLDTDKRRAEAELLGQKTISVVPKQHYLFEAEDVSYRRVDVTAVQKFKEYIAQFDSGVVIGEVPPPAAELPEGDPLFTFIDLLLMSKGGSRSVFVLEGVIYIMNDEGKTVDSIRV